MSAIARRRTGSRRRRETYLHLQRAAHCALSPTYAQEPTINPHRRGGTVVFEIYFTCAMTDRELELLRRQLHMTTHIEHKLPVDPNSPAIARVDAWSGLFLERVRGDDRWVLQARTWGTPSPATIHDWHLRVAQVARQLDRRVEAPERAPLQPSGPRPRPVGRAANRRCAALRRRLVGLR